MAIKMGVAPLLPWVKRNMIMSHAFFWHFSVPLSPNDWTKRTLEDYVPRCEKACAICARKDWIENLGRVSGCGKDDGEGRAEVQA